MSDSPSSPDIPDFAILAADPEIAPLLDFEPVVRKVKRPDGWFPELQGEFIALLAWTGSPRRAAEAMGKKVSGVEALYRERDADSFRASWDAAVAIGRARSARPVRAFTGRPPGSGSGPEAMAAQPLPGQIRNERGEWEDEESVMRRVDEARDSIAAKLLRCRRLYLQEISGSAGKRAAFEILTELPVDWDKAERLEPQPDEPWHRANMRQPDMLLTAENGWMGELTPANGNDKKEALRKAVDEYRAEEGLEPVDWEADDSNHEDHQG